MTAPSVACPNGHENPAYQHFCGECGAALPVTCPNGHRNPPDQRFCGDCGAALRGSARNHQRAGASPSEYGLRTVRQGLPSSQPRHGQGDAQKTSDGDDATGRLKEGVRVQVISTEDKFHRRVGIVRGVTNENGGYTVQVDLEDSAGNTIRRTFRSDQLKLVDHAAQRPISQRSPHEPKTDLPSRSNSQLGTARGLSTGAKIGIALAAGLLGFALLMIVIVVKASSNPHDQPRSPSYHMGYDDAAPSPGQPGPGQLTDALITADCNNFLQWRINDAKLGTRTVPSNFSSQDYLAGCAAALEPFRSP